MRLVVSAVCDSPYPYALLAMEEGKYPRIVGFFAALAYASWAKHEFPMELIAQHEAAPDSRVPAEGPA